MTGQALNATQTGVGALTVRGLVGSNGLRHLPTRSCANLFWTQRQLCVLVFSCSLGVFSCSRVLWPTHPSGRAALQSLPEEEIMLQLPEAVRPRFAEYE